MKSIKTLRVKKKAGTNKNHKSEKIKTKQKNNAVNDENEKNKYFVEQETEIHTNGDFQKRKIKQENVSDSKRRSNNDRAVKMKKRKIDEGSSSENSESDDCTDNEDKIDNRKRKYDTDEDYVPSDDSRSSASSEENVSNEDEADSTSDCMKNDSDEDDVLSKINRKRKYDSDSITSEETVAELPLSCKFLQKMNNKYLDQYLQNILCEKEQTTVVDNEIVHEENLNQLNEPCEEKRTSGTVEEPSLQKESIERKDSEQTLSKNIDPHANNVQQMLVEKTSQLDGKKVNLKICKVILCKITEKELLDNACMQNKLLINQITDKTVDNPSINTLCIADEIPKNDMYLKATKKFTDKKSSLDDYMENILLENARNCELAKSNEPKNKTLNDYIENILMENAGNNTTDKIIVPEHDESLKVQKITLKVEKSLNENENDELEEEKENSDFASPSSPTEFAEHALQITEKVKKKRLCLDDYIENILFENANTVESNMTGPPTGEWIESFSNENTISKTVIDSVEEEMEKMYSKLEIVENYKLENVDPESGKIIQKTSILCGNETNEWWTDVDPNICAENTLLENISINIASEDIDTEENVKKVQVKFEKSSDDYREVFTENLNNNELFDEKLEEKRSHLDGYVEDVLPENIEEFQINELTDPLYLNEFVETTLQENSKSDSSSEDGKQTQCTKLEKSYEILLTDNSRSNNLTEVSGSYKKTSSLHEYMENILSENARNDENIDTTELLTDSDTLCEKQNIGIPKTGIKLEKSPCGYVEIVLLQEKLDSNDYVEKVTENAKNKKLSNKSSKTEQNVSVFNTEEHSRIRRKPTNSRISLEDSFFPQRCYSCRKTFKNSVGLKEHIRKFHDDRKPFQKLGTHSAVKLKSTT